MSKKQTLNSIKRLLNPERIDYTVRNNQTGLMYRIDDFNLAQWTPNAGVNGVRIPERANEQIFRIGTFDILF
jgi:hypothetical protein